MRDQLVHRHHQAAEEQKLIIVHIVVTKVIDDVKIGVKIKSLDSDSATIKELIITILKTQKEYYKEAAASSKNPDKWREKIKLMMKVVTERVFLVKL